MTRLSIRLPDDMAEKLKNFAKVRDMSLNKLMVELSAQALAEEEAKCNGSRLKQVGLAFTAVLGSN